MTDNVVSLSLKMPGGLLQQVRMLAAPRNPDFAGLPSLEPNYDPQAAAWLKRKRDMIKPASREGCHDWFVMVSSAYNGVSADLIERREIAVWMMCLDLPDLVWCRDTILQIWQQAPKFLPTPGEVRPVLESYVAPLLVEIAALERIAAMPAPDPRVRVAAPYEIPPAPEWTQSRHVPRAGLGYRADDSAASASSLGEAVRRVQADLAARKPASGAEPPVAE